MKKEIKVSAIIPVYNIENYIEKCLISLIEQTYQNIEIIVVNDGSTDKSLEHIVKFSKIDSRIKVINKKNGGLSSARNIGILESTGEYICHIDGDDYIELTMIEKMVENTNFGEIDVIIVGANLDYGQEKKEFKEAKICEIISGKEYLENYFFKNKSSNAIWNKMWRRTLYIKNKIEHPEGISLGEDGLTVPKLMYSAKKVKKIEENLYNYRQDTNGMTKNHNKKILQYLLCVEKLKQYFENINQKEFISNYIDNYKYNLFYAEVLNVPQIIAKKQKLFDYVTGYNYLKEEIKEISKNKKILSTLSKKGKLKLKLYSINFILGDIGVILWNKIKK